MGIQPLILNPHWLFSFSTNTNFFMTYFLFIYFNLHYVLLIVCHCDFFAMINFCLFDLFCLNLNPFYLRQNILLKYVKVKASYEGQKIDKDVLFVIPVYLFHPKNEVLSSS